MAPKAPTAAFAVNQKIMHAKHGIGTITSIETNNYTGVDLTYYVVAFERDKLLMRIPLTGSGALELRAIRDKDGDKVLSRVIAALAKKPKVSSGRRWKNREDDLKQKLNSGDLESLAEVVRDLYVSGETERAYSATLIYENALRRLVDEVALIKEVDEVAACAYLAQASEKALTLPRELKAVRVGGIAPDILNAERHQLPREARPQSAMEARLASRAPNDRAPVLKPSELAAAEEARRVIVRRTTPVVPTVASRPASSPTPPPALRTPEKRAVATPKPAPAPRVKAPVVVVPPAAVKPPPAPPVEPATSIPAVHAPSLPPALPPSAEDAAVIAALRKALDEAMQGKEALVTVNRSLEEQLEAANQKRIEAEQKFQRVVPVVTGAEATKRQLATLEETHQETLAALKAAEAEKAVLQTRLHAETETEGPLLAARGTALAEALQQLTDARKERGNTKRSLTSARKRETRLDEEVKTLKAILRKLNNSVETLERANRLLEAQRNEFKTQLTNEQTTLGATIAALEATRSELATAKATLAAAESCKAAQVASNRSLAEQHEAEVAALTTQLATAEEALTASKQARRVLVTDLERVTAERDDTLSSIALLHETLATLRRELGQKKALATKATSSNKRLKELLREAELVAKEATMTRAKLERMDAVRRELVRFIEQLKM